ncbi:hypothetical protein C8R43DRAFT_944819 [Mycena crocata]|nr:hypothetical protein C8R43DRAFT_944819 [Mycena crocata]
MDPPPGPPPAPPPAPPPLPPMMPVTSIVPPQLPPTPASTPRQRPKQNCTNMTAIKCSAPRHNEPPAAALNAFSRTPHAVASDPFSTPHSVPSTPSTFTSTPATPATVTSFTFERPMEKARHKIIWSLWSSTFQLLPLSLTFIRSRFPLWSK